MFKNFKANFEKFFVIFLLFITGFLVFLSLVTHNNLDNSFFKYDSSISENKNFLGFLGSLISAFLFDIFGNISFVIPLFFIFHSSSIFLGKKLTWYNWSLLPFLLIFSCILVEFISANYSDNFLGGGLLGIGLYNYLNYFLEDFWNPIIIFLLIITLTLTVFFLSLNIQLNQFTRVLGLFYNSFLYIFFIFIRFFNIGKNLKIENFIKKKKNNYKKSNNIQLPKICEI